MDLKKAKIIDLTHYLSDDMPVWNLDCRFHSEILTDYKDCPTETKFRVQKYTMPAGIGTHIDSPAHCIEGGHTVDQLSLNQLLVPCVVIDVSHKADEGYTISLEDVIEFEQCHGTIDSNTLVIFHTGWGKYWHDLERYRNNFVFSSVSSEVATLLISRNIAGIGIDTLSPDRVEGERFPVHTIILSSGRYIIENVANAHQLPPTGAFCIALPLKVKAGAEAPMRLIALLE